MALNSQTITNSPNREIGSLIPSEAKIQKNCQKIIPPLVLINHKNAPLRNLGLVTIISTICTSFVCAIYYGLSYNAAKLPGNLYVNNALNGFFPIFGYLIFSPVMSFVGRVKLNSTMIIACGVCCLMSLTFKTYDCKFIICA